MRQGQCLGSYKGLEKRFADVERELVLRERKDVKAHTGPKKICYGLQELGRANENSVSDHVLNVLRCPEMSFNIQTTIKGLPSVRKHFNLILAEPHTLMDTHGLITLLSTGTVL